MSDHHIDLNADLGESFEIVSEPSDLIAVRSALQEAEIAEMEQMLNEL